MDSRAAVTKEQIEELKDAPNETRLLYEAVELFREEGGAYCPFCETWTASIGMIGLGYYVLPNGGLRSYSHMLCPKCSAEMEQSTQEQRKTLCNKIEKVFVRYWIKRGHL